MLLWQKRYGFNHIVFAQHKELVAPWESRILSKRMIFFAQHKELAGSAVGEPHFKRTHERRDCPGAMVSCGGPKNQQLAFRLNEK
jgi:hypothetical protein